MAEAPKYKAQFPLTVDNDFESGKKGQDSHLAKSKYQISIKYLNLDELVECAIKYVTWACQNKARDGLFPRGRRVLVDASGKFTSTPEEKAEALDWDTKVATLQQVLSGKMLEEALKALGPKP